MSDLEYTITVCPACGVQFHGLEYGHDCPERGGERVEPTEGVEVFTLEDAVLLVREGWHYPLDDTPENRDLVLASLREIRAGRGAARDADELDGSDDGD